MEGGQDGVGGIGEVVLCCWHGMSAPWLLMWMAEGDTPDIWMRADMDQNYKNSMVQEKLGGMKPQ